MSEVLEGYVTLRFYLDVIATVVAPLVCWLS